MRNGVKIAGCLLLLLSVSQAEQKPKHRHSRPVNQQPRYISDDDQVGPVSGPISSNQGLSVIAAALDFNHRRHSRPDCSHLVHDIYEKAGFRYPYASSSDLYRGVPYFERVWEPQPGDLVAWRGHVGIMVNPGGHEFYSSLRSGLGIEEYDSSYWRKRGQPRFYRYVMNHTLSADADGR